MSESFRITRDSTFSSRSSSDLRDTTTTSSSLSFENQSDTNGQMRNTPRLKRNERDCRNDPTSLFLRMNFQHWDLAINQLREDSREARIWLLSTRDDGSLRFRYLPLHLACVQFPDPPPKEFVRELIKAYPEAVKSMDHEGNLPIHIACGNDAMYVAKEIITMLARTYPNTLNVLTKKTKMTPMDIVLQSQSPSKHTLLRSLQRIQNANTHLESDSTHSENSIHENEIADHHALSFLRTPKKRSSVKIIRNDAQDGSITSDQREDTSERSHSNVSTDRKKFIEPLSHLSPRQSLQKSLSSDGTKSNKLNRDKEKDYLEKIAALEAELTKSTRVIRTLRDSRDALDAVVGNDSTKTQDEMIQELTSENRALENEVKRLAREHEKNRKENDDLKFQFENKHPSSENETDTSALLIENLTREKETLEKDKDGLLQDYLGLKNKVMDFENELLARSQGIDCLNEAGDDRMLVYKIEIERHLSDKSRLSRENEKLKTLVEENYACIDSNRSRISDLMEKNTALLDQMSILKKRTDSDQMKEDMLKILSQGEEKVDEFKKSNKMLKQQLAEAETREQNLIKELLSTKQNLKGQLTKRNLDYESELQLKRNDLKQKNALQNELLEASQTYQSEIVQLQKSLNELETRNENLEHDKNEMILKNRLRDDKDDLKAEDSNHGNKIDHLNSELERLQQNNLLLNKKVSDLNTTLAEHMQRINEKDIMIEIGRKKLNEMLQDKISLQTKITEIKEIEQKTNTQNLEENDKLKESLKELTSLSETHQETFEAEIDKLRNENTTLSEELNSLLQQYESCSSDLNTTMDKLQNSKAEILAFKSDSERTIDELSSALEKLQVEANKLKCENSIMEKMSLEKEVNISSIKAISEDLAMQVDELKEENTQLQSDIAKILHFEEKCCDQAKELHHMNEEKGNLIEETVLLKDKISLYDRKQIQLEERNSDLEIKNNILQSDYETCQAQLNDQTQSSLKRTKEVETLQENLLSLKEDKENLSKTIEHQDKNHEIEKNSLFKGLDSLTEENKAMKNELESTYNDLENVKEELNLLNKAFNEKNHEIAKSDENTKIMQDKYVQEMKELREKQERITQTLNELQKKYDRLHADSQEQNREFNEMGEKLKNEHNKSLQSEAETMRVHKLLESSNDELISLRKILQETKLKLSNHLERHKDEICKLTDENDKKETVNITLKDTIKELHNVLQKSQLDNTELNKLINDTEEVSSSTIKSLNDHINIQKNNISSLTTKIDITVKEKSSFTKDIAKLKERISILTNENREAKKALILLREESHKKSTLNETINEDLVALKAQYELITGKIEIMSQEIDSYKEDIEVIHVGNLEIPQEKVPPLERISRMILNLKNIQIENARLKNKILGSEKIEQSLTTNVNDLKVQLEETQSEIYVKEKNFSEAEEILSSKIENLNEHIKLQKNSISSLNNAVQSLALEKKSSHKEIEELKEMVSFFEESCKKYDCEKDQKLITRQLMPKSKPLNDATSEISELYYSSSSSNSSSSEEESILTNHSRLFTSKNSLVDEIAKLVTEIELQDTDVDDLLSNGQSSEIVALVRLFIEKLKMEKTLLLSELSDAKSGNSDVDNSNKSLKGYINDLNKQLESSNSQANLIKLTEEREHLSGKEIKNLKKEIRTQKEIVLCMNEKIQKLEKEIADINSEFDDLEDSTSCLEKEVADLTIENLMLRKQIEDQIQQHELDQKDSKEMEATLKEIIGRDEQKGKNLNTERKLLKKYNAVLKDKLTVHKTILSKVISVVGREDLHEKKILPSNSSKSILEEPEATSESSLLLDLNTGKENDESSSRLITEEEDIETSHIFPTVSMQVWRDRDKINDLLGSNKDLQLLTANSQESLKSLIFVMIRKPIQDEQQKNNVETKSCECDEASQNEIGIADDVDYKSSYLENLLTILELAEKIKLEEATSSFDNQECKDDDIIGQCNLHETLLKMNSLILKDNDVIARWETQNQQYNVRLSFSAETNSLGPKLNLFLDELSNFREENINIQKYIKELQKYMNDLSKQNYPIPTPAFSTDSNDLIDDDSTLVTANTKSSKQNSLNDESGLPINYAAISETILEIEAQKDDLCSYIENYATRRRDNERKMFEFSLCFEMLIPKKNEDSLIEMSSKEIMTVMDSLDEKRDMTIGTDSDENQQECRISILNSEVAILAEAKASLMRENLEQKKDQEINIRLVLDILERKINDILDKLNLDESVMQNVALENDHVRFDQLSLKGSPLGNTLRNIVDSIENKILIFSLSRKELLSENSLLLKELELKERQQDLFKRSIANSPRKQKKVRAANLYNYSIDEVDNDEDKDQVQVATPSNMTGKTKENSEVSRPTVSEDSNKKNAKIIEENGLLQKYNSVLKQRLIAQKTIVQKMQSILVKSVSLQNLASVAGNKTITQ